MLPVVQGENRFREVELVTADHADRQAGLLWMSQEGVHLILGHVLVHEVPRVELEVPIQHLGLT